MKGISETPFNVASWRWAQRLFLGFVFVTTIAPVAGQDRLVVPNGFENVEGNSNGIALFGGQLSETQIIYGSQHFSSFPSEGAFITELRFRLDGQYSSSLNGSADLEIRLST